MTATDTTKVITRAISKIKAMAIRTITSPITTGMTKWGMKIRCSNMPTMIIKVHLNIISTMMDMMTLLVKLVAVVLMILKLIINMHVLAL